MIKKDSPPEKEQIKPRPESNKTDGSGLPDDLLAKLEQFEKRMTAKTEETKNGEDAPQKPTYVVDLENKLAEKDALLREYIAEHKKAVKGFEEAKNRIRKTVDAEIEQGKREILREFLELMDDLDRAIKSAKNDPGDTEKFVQGISMIGDRFLKIMEKFGVSRIDSEGRPFDPNLHEALGTTPVDDDSQDEIITQVIKDGYLINDELLRPATVLVGKLTS